MIVWVCEELEGRVAAERDLADNVHGAEKAGHFAHANLAVPRAPERVNLGHVNHLYR